MTARPRQAGTFRCSDSLRYRSRAGLSNSRLPVGQVAMEQVLGKLQRTSYFRSFGFTVTDKCLLMCSGGCSGKSVCIFFPSLTSLVTDTMNKAREKERGREGGRKERERARGREGGRGGREREKGREGESTEPRPQATARDRAQRCRKLGMASASLSLCLRHHQQDTGSLPALHTRLQVNGFNLGLIASTVLINVTFHYIKLQVIRVKENTFNKCSAFKSLLSKCKPEKFWVGESKTSYNSVR